MSVQIERLARIECKLHTIGEIVIHAASFGLGAALGYMVEHYSTMQGWGWPAATAAGVSAVVFASWWRSDFFWHESWDKQRKRAQERARAQAGNG